MPLGRPVRQVHGGRYLDGITSLPGRLGIAEDCVPKKIPPCTHEPDVENAIYAIFLLFTVIQFCESIITQFMHPRLHAGGLFYPRPHASSRSTRLNSLTARRVRLKSTHDIHLLANYHRLLGCPPLISSCHGTSRCSFSRWWNCRRGPRC